MQRKSDFQVFLEVVQPSSITLTEQLFTDSGIYFLIRIVIDSVAPVGHARPHRAVQHGAWWWQQGITTHSRNTHHWQTQQWAIMLGMTEPRGQRALFHPWCFSFFLNSTYLSAPLHCVSLPSKDRGGDGWGGGLQRFTVHTTTEPVLTERQLRTSADAFLMATCLWETGDR